MNQLYKKKCLVSLISAHPDEPIKEIVKWCKLNPVSWKEWKDDIGFRLVSNKKIITRPYSDYKSKDLYLKSPASQMLPKFSWVAIITNSQCHIIWGTTGSARDRRLRCFIFKDKWLPNQSPMSLGYFHLKKIVSIIGKSEDINFICETYGQLSGMSSTKPWGANMVSILEKACNRTDYKSEQNQLGQCTQQNCQKT